MNWIQERDARYVVGTDGVRHVTVVDSVRGAKMDENRSGRFRREDIVASVLCFFIILWGVAVAVSIMG